MRAAASEPVDDLRARGDRRGLCARVPDRTPVEEDDTMKLNHLDLCVTDVGATAAFFTEHFGLHLQAMKGRDALAILRDEAGFTLVISRARDDEAHRYPDDFHVGFLLDRAEAVHEAYARLREAGVATDDPPRDVRGGATFYVRGPERILIEVAYRPSGPSEAQALADTSDRRRRA
jgi:catechol 2,3-dioxygenase-like lactoylglutathione lyase family enzyme